MLRLGLVDRHDREAQRAVGGHRLEPDDAGRRLLGAGEDLPDLVRALAVKERHEVAAVVHRDLRPRIGDLVQVLVVGVAVLAAAGERRDPVLGDERGRDVVLRGQRVRGREVDLRATRGKGPHEVRGLRRDVEARPDPQALERAISLEALADEAQDRHLPLRPLDPPDALRREPEIGDVMWRQRAAGDGGGTGGVEEVIGGRSPCG